MIGDAGRLVVDTGPKVTLLGGVAGGGPSGTLVPPGVYTGYPDVPTLGVTGADAATSPTASLNLLCDSTLTKGDELPATGSNTSMKFTLVGGAFSAPVPCAPLVMGIGSKSRRLRVAPRFNDWLPRWLIPPCF